MAILQISDLAELCRTVSQWQSAGDRVALVPTMGNLHAGHIELAVQARKQADRVVASVFVNPAQFGPGEDLDAYPRTLKEDCEKLDEAGVDLVFTPAASAVYPRGYTDLCVVEPPKNLANILCGAFRPGHFRGVATVVNKLFNMVQPDLALFGEKDFQQLMVIRSMVADLNIPVDIIGVPTVREADGLAMSSRNQYLSGAERKIAPALYAVLKEAAGKLRSGKPADDVECQSIQALDAAGFRAEYVSVRAAADLSDPPAGETELLVLAAARLGPARLIDNLRVSL